MIGITIVPFLIKKTIPFPPDCPGGDCEATYLEDFSTIGTRWYDLYDNTPDNVNYPQADGTD